MTFIQVEWAWMGTDTGTRETINQQDLSHCCGLAESDLDELIEYSALVPAERTSDIPHTFSTEWIAPLREAGKMRADFDLDLFTVALLLAKMSRIEILEREVLVLQAQIPFHALSRLP
jgi:chaperone modulatory protein CbpM